MSCITSIGKVSPGSNGYAKLYDPKSKKKVKAHRWVFEKFWGQIPSGLVIKHSCDNRACTNINHLSADTQGSNLQDMWDKGRGGSRNWKRGDGHNMVTISDVEVSRIRSLPYKRGLYLKLSKEYGVSRQTIRNIYTGKTRNYKPPYLEDLVK